MHGMLLVIVAVVGVEVSTPPEMAVGIDAPIHPVPSMTADAQPMGPHRILIDEEDASVAGVAHVTSGGVSSDGSWGGCRVVSQPHPARPSMLDRLGAWCRYRRPTFPDYYYHRPFDPHVVFDYPWHKDPRHPNCGTCLGPGATTIHP